MTGNFIAFCFGFLICIWALSDSVNDEYINRKYLSMCIESNLSVAHCIEAHDKVEREAK